MSQVRVRVENVSKRFRLGVIGADSLREGFAALARRLRGHPGEVEHANDLWALCDVSFELRDGEAMGVIGKNGAGKSTLLKLLSRITEPTRGRIVLDGRVSSLLEVGTGFHPELTGRENVYLNGSILGMTRAEIRRKFDEIVAFSGVETFLDTPVKRYSSGMYVRLAFAVAAHLEPEILIIDEVLAVGDAEFQKKCLGKMSDAASQGRTVLFVSHNMAAVESLCSRAIYLRGGRIAADGAPPAVIASYLHDAARSTGAFTNGELTAPEGHLVRRIRLSADGQPSSLAWVGCDLEIEVDFESPTPLRFPVLGFVVRDRLDTPLVAINNRHYTGNLVEAPVTAGTIAMRIPTSPFVQGDYSVDVYLGDGAADVDVLRDAFVLSVEARRLTEASLLPNPTLNRFFVRDVQWSFAPRTSGVGR